MPGHPVRRDAEAPIGVFDSGVGRALRAAGGGCAGRPRRESAGRGLQHRLGGRIAVIATEGTVRGGAYLRAILARLGTTVTVVDSAATTAVEVAAALARAGLARPVAAGAGRTRFLVTDGPERFARVGAVFLGSPVAADAVELVDLAGASGSTM